MVLFFIYRNFTCHQQNKWEDLSEIHHTLSYNFVKTETSLIYPNAIVNSCQILNHTRDSLRDWLYIKDYSAFPRHGPVTTAIEKIFDCILIMENSFVSVHYKCPRTTSCTFSFTLNCNNTLPTLLTSSLWKFWNNTNIDIIPIHSIQKWFDCYLQHTLTTKTISNIFCNDNSQTQHPPHLSVDKPPTTIAFENLPDIVIDILHSTVLQIPCLTSHYIYNLRAITYTGHNHFTACLINNDGQILSYDSQQQNGTPWTDENCCHLHLEAHRLNLTKFANRSIHLLIFTHTETELDSCPTFSQSRAH